MGRVFNYQIENINFFENQKKWLKNEFLFTINIALKIQKS